MLLRLSDYLPVLRFDFNQVANMMIGGNAPWVSHTHTDREASRRRQMRWRERGLEVQEVQEPPGHRSSRQLVAAESESVC